jgi:membrane associated rhomboid family serine protease
MTWLIILANGLVFAYELSLPPPVLKGFFFDFGIVPARYFHSGGLSGAGLPLLDYLPFLSSMFLHGGWAHILGNMWFLYLFGDNVEDRMGHVRFLVFYLLSGLSAGAIHYWTNIHSTLPTIGASGAIAGVMGAYFVLYPRSRIITLVPIFFYPLFLEIPAILFLFFWFLTQILSGSLALASGESFGGIAWWAHAGGFAAGIVLQFLFVRSRGHHRFYFETEHAPW